MTSSDNTNIDDLIRRVSSLDSDVKTLRTEFEQYRTKSSKADDAMSWAMTSITGKLDDHIKKEDKKYIEQNAIAQDQIRKLDETQKAIASLSAELKEPMEVYRTAKYGAKATTMLVTFVRWAVPIGVALLIGYNALQTRLINELVSEHPTKTQQEK